MAVHGKPRDSRGILGITQAYKGSWETLMAAIIDGTSFKDGRSQCYTSWNSSRQKNGDLTLSK